MRMRYLLIAGAAALALGLAGCGGGSDDDSTADAPVTMPDPMPEPMPVAVDLMGSGDLMAGMTTIAAGESVTVGYTTVSCAAGGADCALTITRDEVTGAMSASSLGGMLTVAVMMPEPPPVPPMQTACEMGAGMACIDQRTDELTAARAALATAMADGSSTQDQLSAAQMAVTDAQNAVMSAQAGYDVIRVRTVALPEGHGLNVGTSVLPQGDTTTVDGTTITCGGASGCTLTVTEDTVTGQHMATATGGMVSVMVAEAPMPPPVDPEPTPTAIELPEGNTIHEQLVASGPTRLTIAAGNSADYGGVQFTCPEGGADCVVEFTADLNMASAEAPVGSGVAGAADVPDPPNPAFGGGDAPGFLSNENLLAAIRNVGGTLTGTRGFDANDDGYNDFTPDTAVMVGATDNEISGLPFRVAAGPLSSQSIDLYSTVGPGVSRPFTTVYGPNVSPSTDDGFWSKLMVDTSTLAEGAILRNTAASGNLAGTNTYAAAGGNLRCVSGVCTIERLGGRVSGTGAWRFTPAAGATTTVADDNYIVFGWWQNRPTGLDRETQVLWAGSDPFESANVAGLTGTATYQGGAAGHYEVRETGENQLGLGTFTGNATLNANFSTENISGSITTITGVPVTNPTAGDAMLPMPANISVVLGNTSISGSTFSGAVRIDTAADEHTTSGSWNGQFFGNGISVLAHPSSIAGEFTAQTGSRTVVATEIGPDDMPVSGATAYINLNGAFGADID